MQKCTLAIGFARSPHVEKSIRSLTIIVKIPDEHGFVIQQKDVTTNSMLIPIQFTK